MPSQRPLAEEPTPSSPPSNSKSKVGLFLRLTRAQFLPLILLPAGVGTAFAYSTTGRLNLSYFMLVLAGVTLLHLGANAIDDAFDYQNGVDTMANSMFPKDFGGWKPIPRGKVSLRFAKAISFALFAGSLVVGAYFWYYVGFLAFVLAFFGFLLATFYCAPPLKLDYRGMGLGEAAILFAFGPIPVLGAFYVQTGFLSLPALMVSLPVGLLTVTILLDHDLIFYEVYSRSGKRSLATVLGRKQTLLTSLVLTIASYAIVFALAAIRILPIYSLFAPLASVLILARKRRAFTRANEPPPYYVSLTVNGLLANWIFGLVLAISLIVSAL